MGWVGPTLSRVGGMRPAGFRRWQHGEVTRDDLIPLLVDRVLAAVPADRPGLVAVDGADGAGKTVLARALADALGPVAPGSVVHVPVDGFHRPREDRYRRGRSSPQSLWFDSYSTRAASSSSRSRRASARRTATSP